MGSLLKPNIGVAVGAPKWDLGEFQLWQSTEQDIILFSPRQPSIARNKEGRYQFGVSQIKGSSEGTYKITGGSAAFSIDTGIQFDEENFEAVREQWLSEMADKFDHKIPKNPRFVPLNTRKGRAQVLMGAYAGAPHEAHNDKDIGTPGGVSSFLVELSEVGVQEWVQGIKQNSIIPVTIKMDYEYLAMVPTISAHVRIDSKRIFRHFSGELDASYKGFAYGGSVNIQAEMEKMMRTQAIEVIYKGTAETPEIEELRKKMVDTFLDETYHKVMEALFEPAPDVPPAEAGDTGGFFGGANLALKYKSESEVIDLSFDLSFEGWTWLRSDMGADMTSLIASLDDSYITEVDTQMTAPATLVVDGDPEVESVVFSWGASEGKAPESGVIGQSGDVKTFLVTSQDIDNVEISYDVKINYSDSKWDFIRQTKVAKFNEGGSSAAIKPSSYIGRHDIFMFYHDNDMIIPPGPNDFLVCNVSVNGEHLTRAINDSGRITGMEPVLFSYPRSPRVEEKTEVHLSAFGVVNGRFVRSKGRLKVNTDEQSLFILVDTDGKVEIVGENTLLSESESRNSLAGKLRRAGARPVYSSPSGQNETDRPVTGNPDQSSGNNSEELTGDVRVTLASGEVVDISHPNGADQDNGSQVVVDIDGKGDVQQLVIKARALN